jgi:hypothetical protein
MSNEFSDKRKMHMCVTVPIGVKQGIEDSAKLFGMSQSKLLIEGYFEYLHNHYSETVKPVTLNVTYVQEAMRPEKVKVELCEIAHCKNKVGSAIGVYGSRQFKLCKDHEGKYAGIKGWIVK